MTMVTKRCSSNFHRMVRLFSLPRYVIRCSHWNDALDNLKTYAELHSLILSVVQYAKNAPIRYSSFNTSLNILGVHSG